MGAEKSPAHIERLGKVEYIPEPPHFEWLTIPLLAFGAIVALGSFLWALH